MSHKTQQGRFGPARTDLRVTALEWMRRQGFFSETGFGIPPRNVRFTDTRSEKIKQIAQLGCTHFVDDLAELLDDPNFPPGVARVLFTKGAHLDRPRADAFAHWHDIAEAVLR